jgi:thiamine-phosphate pyrophosphorylase
LKADREPFKVKKNNLALDKSLVYLITDGLLATQNFSEKSCELLNLITIAVENEVSLIQIREKKLTVRLVYKLTTKAVEIAKNSKTKILVNDRADIAFAANADGVHLTSNSLPAKTIRKHFPADFIVGVSAHSLTDIETAQQQGANFATFSPIFHSPDKGEPKGLEELRKACEKMQNFPIVALGGIDETNYNLVLETGAAGFAAIRFLSNRENLRNLKKEL